MSFLLSTTLISLSVTLSVIMILRSLLGLFSRKRIQNRRFRTLAKQLNPSNIPSKIKRSSSEANVRLMIMGEYLVQEKYKMRLRNLSNQLGSDSETRLSDLIQKKIYLLIIGALLSLVLVTQGRIILVLPTLLITVLASFLPDFGLLFTRLLKGNYGKKLGALASTSGTKWVLPEKLVIAKLISSISAFLFSYVFFVLKSESWAGLSYLPLSLIIGFFIPDLILYNKVIKRRQIFEETLPDAIDLLSMCVNAGLAFPSALQKVSEVQKGPVPEEFLRVRAEVQLGKERNEALKEMSDRMKVEALKNFVNAVGQVDRFGIPISSALIEQSRELRAERKTRGREKAQKVPIKILGPVMLCFLPCILLVVLGPAIIGIIAAF